MKNSMASVSIFVFAAVIFYSLFGPVLVGIFFLCGALYFLCNREPSKILAFVCAVISLACYHGFVYWGWGQ